MDLTTFTQRVYDVLCEHFPDREFELDIEAGTISSGQLRFGMANLLAEYRQNPVSDTKFKRAIVENFTQAFAITESADAMMPVRWDDTKDRLRMQLANRRIHELENVITFPFSADVVSAVVVDAPNGYAYVGKDDAQRWDQSAVDLLEVSRENLMRASKNMNMYYVPGPLSVIAFGTNDGYDAARILLPDVRKYLIEKLMDRRGDAVHVGIPNRDFLIAWPSDASPEMDRRMKAQLSSDAASQHHPLTSTPMRVTVETITPLEP